MPPKNRLNELYPRLKLMTGFLVLAVVQLLSFQNCGSDFVVKDGLNFQASASSCDLSLEPSFESSYYPFLKTNCVSCHSGSGPGQGSFAASDPDIAFSAFLAATPDKVDLNATNAAHAGGYTGSQNSSAIALASQEWSAADATCKSASGSSQNPLILTTTKIMNAGATAKDITWNLDSEIATSLAATGGATLTLAVTLNLSANGSPVYTFSNLRLNGGTRPVVLNGVMVRINNQSQILGSTWSRVSGTAAATSTIVLSASPMIIEYDSAVATTDRLSLSIGSIH